VLEKVLCIAATPDWQLTSVALQEQRDASRMGQGAFTISYETEKQILEKLPVRVIPPALFFP